MDKIITFVKKHCIAIAVVAILVIFLVAVIRWIVQRIFSLMGKGIGLLSEFLVKLVTEREYWELLMDGCNVTQFQILNAVVFYMSLCLTFVILTVCVSLVILIVIECVEKIMGKTEEIILGKRHQKSLEYKGWMLWFIKCKADILFFLDWLKYDVLKTRCFYEDEITLVKWARIFSPENVICIVKKAIRFFFRTNVVHLLLGGITIYIYFEKNILNIYENFKDIMLKSEIGLTHFIEMFEVMTILCVFIYIALDVRHKASGYSEMRMERFRELVQMEEKLLSILCGISYSLEKNIKVIADCKRFILQNGASELSGKQCYISDGSIKFEDKEVLWHRRSDDGMWQLSKLDDMQSEFQKLAELENEFKKSSLNYSNIYLIDSEAMIMRVGHFWIPGIDDSDYKKMEFFCKSSMEEWYRNWFIKPIEGDRGVKNYYPEEQAKEEIIEVSALLDYELMRAFWLELCLKKYKRKLTRRFKKINKFSQFNLK